MADKTKALAYLQNAQGLLYDAINELGDIKIGTPSRLFVLSAVFDKLRAVQHKLDSALDQEFWN